MSGDTGEKKPTSRGNVEADLKKAQARIAELEGEVEDLKHDLTRHMDIANEYVNRTQELEGALREIEAFDPDCAQTYIARAALEDTPTTLTPGMVYEQTKLGRKR